MKSARLITMIALVFLVGLSLTQSCFAANYTYSYWLLDHSDGSNRYELTVSATSSLHDYYLSKDHNLYSLDFAKFVTPHPLKPIADNLWSIYSNEEDFSNGVLMIVHQIPYAESAPQKYPVETIVQNEGDCDLLSLVVASIMLAGGLDVVLFYYETEKHMNVGVYLSSTPNDARTSIYYVSYNGKPYYMAETTGGNWEKGWRVGECPDELKSASAQIITLENAEQASPGQVSAGYNLLASSSILLALSPKHVVLRDTVTISGQITPAGSATTVTIYLRRSSSQWRVLGTAQANSNGRFSYLWIPDSLSTYYIRASWSGDSQYAGADSDIHTLMVLPFDWTSIMVISIALAGTIVVVVAIAVLKRKKPMENIFPNEEPTEAFT